MNCPVCGKELKPTQKFCPACGTKLAQQPEQPPQEFEKTWQPQAEPEGEAQPPEGYEATWQPQTDYPAAEQQFEQPEQGGFPEGQPMPDPEAPFAQEASSAPPKKKVSIVTIIVIAGAALLLIAGGVFAAYKLGLFGGGDNKDDKSSSSDTSQSAQAPQEETKPTAEIESLVQRFEKALNDDDQEAMAALFLKEENAVKARSAVAVSALADKTIGGILNYTCSLSDLEFENGNETAKGDLDISIEVQVPLKTINSNASFIKSGGTWYIDSISFN